MSQENSRTNNLSPSMQTMQIIWPGAMAAQAMYAAAKLGIADALKDGPRAIDDLAHATETHGPSLRRLLRALTSLGVFAESTEGKFKNTDLSDSLRSDHPESVRAWAIFLGAPFIWKTWMDLCETVRTGQPAANRVYGKPFFAHLAEHSDDAAVFNAAMSAGSDMIGPLIVSAYDFSRFQHIVDVGGGHGALLHAILSTNPDLHGLLYDLPAVIAGAALLRRGPIAGRCELLGGDFFEAVPGGADAYVLKGIIHDWNDDDALTILKNCRRAIRHDGRLLLLETILEPSNESDLGKFMDVLMLTLVGGRERTEADFRTLLREAGFSLTRIIPAGPSSIIESQPM